MSERPRPKRVARSATVLRTETLSPSLVRIVFGGPDLAALPELTYTDHYVKLLFPPPGVSYPEPFDLAAIRENLPPAQWPVTRTYTVRRWLPELPELWLDFVVHGDEGIAGPWATNARPGDPVRFHGPGGAYAPDPAAGWHLLAGDESALPAIAAALERMPDSAVVHALVEVSDAAEEQKLQLPDGIEIRWLHRDGGQVGEALVAAVRALPFPDGDVHVFVHGEANLVKALRGHLRLERGVPPGRMSISGYWRRGLDEDGWQSTKRDWNQQVEREQGS